MFYSLLMVMVENAVDDVESKPSNVDLKPSKVKAFYHALVDVKPSIEASFEVKD